MNELASLSGSYFDPEVIEAFGRYFATVIEPRSRRLSERTTMQEARQGERSLS
jgi:response regulator RpfG family c-di-GMP phosphodiesterase